MEISVVKFLSWVYRANLDYWLYLFELKSEVCVLRKKTPCILCLRSSNINYCVNSIYSSICYSFTSFISNIVISYNRSYWWNCVWIGVYFWYMDYWILKPCILTSYIFFSIFKNLFADYRITLSYSFLEGRYRVVSTSKLNSLNLKNIDDSWFHS